MKRIVLALLILVVIGGTAFSFDGSTFPEPIGKNSVLLSPTFNFGFSGFSGSYSGLDSFFVLGMTVSADYALPIPFALAIGLEFGFASTVDEFSDGVVLPILFRVSWHPNFEVRGLDPYIITKVGYSIGASKYVDGGFSWGGGVGCRYFFNDVVGIFGDLGYDRYGVGSSSYSDYWISWSYSWYYYAFFHLGATFKLGGSSSGGSSSSSSSGRYMRVNSDTLNVRSGPSADNAVVGVLVRDARVEVIDKSGAWWRIRSGNIEGYVNSSFLR